MFSFFVVIHSSAIVYISDFLTHEVSWNNDLAFNKVMGLDQLADILPWSHNSLSRP